MKCSRGMARKNGGAKGCGKAAEWKSQKTTFPLRLEIPQTPAGFPLSHSLGDCEILTTNRTFHLLRKGDTSNVVSRGTFLMSVDTLIHFVSTIPSRIATVLTLFWVRSHVQHCLTASSVRCPAYALAWVGLSRVRKWQAN